MVRIDFHFNAPDKIGYVCRLARKARAARKKLVIFCSDTTLLADLDRQLWTFSETDFLPHCRHDHVHAALTPIVLLDGSDVARDALPHHEVLVNLDLTTPPFFTSFERLIEVVTVAEADRQAGRQRWKFYKDRGYELTHHDQSKVQA